jgi:transcriptional regulator with GAF, ATPase, and Fis domain
LSRSGVLATATARTTVTVARAIVSGLETSQVVLARLWLTDHPSDLRLAASAGTPAGGGSYANLDGSFARIPLGAGKIGRIAMSGEPMIVPAIRGDEEWFTNPGWIARQGVRAFYGFPLLDAGDLLGVLAVFERGTVAGDRVDDLRFLADYAAARLASVRERTARAPSPPARPAIVTRDELRAIERETIANALEQTAGRIFGPAGAARLLGMKPTTLASRIKVLGLRVR